MALIKTPVEIGFSKGVDTKTDPFKVAIDNFLSLENSVFTKGGLLQKRNGFEMLTSLSDASSTYASTFNDNLLAIGTTLNAFSQSTNLWVDKGPLQPVKVETLPAIRASTQQSQCDSAQASNGLICVVWTDGPTPVYKYEVIDGTTGQNVVAPTAIPVSSGAVTGSPRVFALGRYFVIVFQNLISATPHLQYVAISITAPTQVSANTDISAQFTPTSGLNFDGVVANNTLYLAWNGSDGGGAIRVTSLASTLVQSSVKAFTGKGATLMSMCADESGPTPVIYAAFYDGGGTKAYVLAVDHALNTVLSPTQVVASGTLSNITCQAASMVCTVFYEVVGAYSYDGGIATDLISSVTITQAGSVGTPTVRARGVGLASKAFTVNGVYYFLAAYQSSYQPSYFLLTGSGQVVSRLAYSNGGGYLTVGLPSAQLVAENVVKISYRYKDLVAASSASGNTSTAPVFSQTGINIVTFTIGTSDLTTAEIGGSLHISGGFPWQYDGNTPVEHGFNVWPDYVEASATATTGGLMTAQIYYYVATYEWTDGAGNIHRSAPSIPALKDISGAGTATSTITVSVPTYRLTYKISNPVRIVLYRWSTAQQTYYQVTSMTNPLLNNVAADSVNYVDTQADSAILGNNILYTAGGVLENIGAPSTDALSLFDSRVWLIDSEDRNLLWFSKQVIEATPVEFSDLQTLYIAPSIGAEGSTGNSKCLAPMDDKLIIFKENAAYYINGSGPDITGANSQYSQPVFITATVGCSNQNSIVFQPSGLMFQSNKGIWLLGRDLSTSYIGASVEAFTQDAVVLSAINVPGTNQVRFTLDSGITLMYDYYYGQWGTFVGIPAVSSTIYNGLHTYINDLGQVYEESPGSYLDGSTPVVMSFTTSWIKLTGLQGFQRAYYFYLLGTYYSPHKLNLGIAYDYAAAPSQTILLTPDNYTAPWGGESVWGGGEAWGGASNIEQWRVFLAKEKCESFQISVQELYDPSLGVVAGPGLTLSGLNLIIGAKKGFYPLRQARSVG